MNFFFYLILVSSISSIKCETSKELSLGAKIHVFLLKLIGKHHVASELKLKIASKEDDNYVHPLHRWMPIKSTTTTTAKYVDYIIGVRKVKVERNGKETYFNEPLNDELNRYYTNLHENGHPLPEKFVKIFS